MCSRFEIKARPETIKRRFRLKRLPGDVETALVPVVRRPTDPTLTVTMGVAPQARILRWGLAVDWDTKPLINARAETLTQKPIFRSLLNNRCLVPASAYFEWRKDAGQRLKNRIAPAHQNNDDENGDEDEGDLIAFAGLVDETRNAVTIITCMPSPAIAHVHGRMPVIINPDRENIWADPARSFDEVADCLLPFDNLAAWEDTPPPPPPPQGNLFA